MASQGSFKGSQTMKATERQLKIRQMLATRDFVDLETLCKELDTSESSIRRDLDILEQERFLRRVYGGAVSLQTNKLLTCWPSKRNSGSRMPASKRRG